MSSTIQFLRDPEYQDTVILFVLAPAGILFEPEEIGKNLFGASRWTHEALLIDGLAPKATFRYSDISFHWPDFLDLAYRHVNHTLFYVPHKHTFKEIGKESLVAQNPDLYSFSFHKLVCESRIGLSPDAAEPVSVPGNGRDITPRRSSDTETHPGRGMRETTGTASSQGTAAARLTEARAALLSMIEAGWSANAVALRTGITAMTIGSIRNGKSTQASTRVHAAIMNMKADSDAGRITPARRGHEGKTSTPDPGAPSADRAEIGSGRQRRNGATETKESSGLRDTHYIAVDAEKLGALIDRLSGIFSEAIVDLQEIRRQLTR